MKIALLAHVRQPIAEPFMGGMEAHSWHLAAGLMGRGHEVVLFASGDSDKRFTIDPILSEHYERTFPWAEHRGSVPLIAHVDAGYANAWERIATGEFDVVHNNSLHRFPLQRANADAVPTVTSLHVPPFDALRYFVETSAGLKHRLTVTSAAQMHAWWPGGAPAEASVLYNGIDPAAWPFRGDGNGESVWCGRITPNKGPHLAIEAARRCGLPLTLFGAIEDPDYWESLVSSGIRDNIRYGGHLRAADLARELSLASVFLFTPCWDEPFGLVAVEAMACGLPVASFDRGAAKEIIAEAGVFVAQNDVAALAHAIPSVMQIPRHIPYSRVMNLFTRDIWLAGCERLYEQAVEGVT